MDPLIKSQLLYQLSYAPHRSRKRHIANQGPDVEGFEAPGPPQNSSIAPWRPICTSRCTEALINSPKPTITASIAVPP